MIYRIADINVEMNPVYDRSRRQSEPYLIADDSHVDMKMNIPMELIRGLNEDNPHLSLEDCEYMELGMFFYTKLLKYNGFFLHSSAISYENKAYLFSAPSGTGKSTHTALWKKHFGDAVVYINDDKPAIRKSDDGFYVYGTPFSGKTDLNTNIRVPLHAICVLERAEENSITRMDSGSALFAILNQTVRPPHPKAMDFLLKLLDNLLKEVPVYLLRCNMEDDAVAIAYRGMNE